MKRGNKIILLFGGVCFLGMLVLLLDLRLNGEWKEKASINLSAKGDLMFKYQFSSKTQLDQHNIKVLTLKAAKDWINVVVADSNQIITESQSLQHITVDYLVSDDTLHIRNFEKPAEIHPHKNRCTIKVKPTLQSIIIDETSVVNFSTGEPTILNISVRQGQLILNKGLKKNIGKMRLEATKGSKISFNQTQVDSLELNMSESNVEIFKTIKLLTGQLNEYSEIKTGRVKVYSLNVDETSKVSSR